MTLAYGIWVLRRPDALDGGHRRTQRRFNGRLVASSVVLLGLVTSAAYDAYLRPALLVVLISILCVAGLRVVCEPRPHRAGLILTAALVGWPLGRAGYLVSHDPVSYLVYLAPTLPPCLAALTFWVRGWCSRLRAQSG